MSKKQKKINSSENVNKIEQEKSVTTIVSEDKKENHVLEDDTSISQVALLEKTSEKENENQIEIDDKLDKNLKEEEKIEENNNKEVEENKKVSEKHHKTFFIISLSILAITALFLVFSTIFAVFFSYNATIVNGVKIKDIDVSGLTKEEAIQKVSSAFDNKLKQSFTLKYNDYELEVFPEQFGISFAIEDAVNTAYSKGRGTNIFQNNYEILSSMLNGININPAFSYSEETLDSLVTEMQTNFPDRLIESSYYIENNNLIISKGKDGVVIDKNKLLSEIIYYINNLYVNTPIINIPVEQKAPTTIDLQKIYNEVYRAPQDAYYTTNPYVVYPHADGIDFAISMEEATKLLQESVDQCSIGLKVLSPNVTTNQIGPEAFPHLLGTYSTTFSTRNINRSTNIRLATQKINGTVIMPDETFSYNQVVGKRTASAGFKSAAVYSGGEVTTGIGGGICQVSSTLYNSVLLANLEIVERYNHGFNTGYVPVGRDATVSWGGPDFKFKNSRNYPVKIIATVSGGTISIQVFGLKSDNEYEVEIQSYVTQYIQYKTIQKQDATLAKGNTKVLQSGSNGCKSVAYRILKQNGEVVSKTLLSRDTYNPHNKIMAVGTKQ